MSNILGCIRLAVRSALPLAVVAALFVPVAPAAEPSYFVSIVKDADLKPYQDAVRGFLSACGCAAGEADLGEDARPRAMLAVGTNAFRKARSRQDLPVVYLMVMPSELTRLADNVSGVSMDISPEAYLSSLTELFPRAKRIGILYDHRNTGAYVAAAAETARKLGLELVAREARSAKEAPALLRGMRGVIDVFWMLPDATVVTPETVDSILLFSIENSVPVMSFSRKYVELGAVAALQAKPYDMGVQAGELAKALTEGAQGPLRQYAKSYRLVLNRTVAEKMGFRFNSEVLRKAE